LATPLLARLFPTPISVGGFGRHAIEKYLLEIVSEGLPLIYDNATALWNEAQEIGTFGNRRAVGILQLFAEEEAAKSLLLFDAVRCPRTRKEEFRRLVSGFGNHLAKGIYVKYYGSRLADLHEARTIVNLKVIMENSSRRIPSYICAKNACM
jgi:hypothetical protein